jgi:hypothetical protein
LAQGSSGEFDLLSANRAQERRGFAIAYKLILQISPNTRGVDPQGFEFGRRRRQHRSDWFQQRQSQLAPRTPSVFSLLRASSAISPERNSPTAGCISISTSLAPACHYAG